jgi:hypothetical protein
MMGLVFAATHPDRLRPDRHRQLRQVAGAAPGLSVRILVRGDREAASGTVPHELGQGPDARQLRSQHAIVAGLREAWSRYERFAASPGVVYA